MWRISPEKGLLGPKAAPGVRIQQAPGPQLRKAGPSGGVILLTHVLVSEHPTAMDTTPSVPYMNARLCQRSKTLNNQSCHSSIKLSHKQIIYVLSVSVIIHIHYLFIWFRAIYSIL